MGKHKAADSQSTNSTTSSIKSLKAVTSKTLKSIKQKTINIISPKKKSKKSHAIPDGNEVSNATTSDGEVWQQSLSSDDDKDTMAEAELCE